MSVKNKILSLAASLLLLPMLTLPAGAVSMDATDPDTMLPVNIILNQDNKEIRKVYDLSHNTDPSTLPMGQFERDGLLCGCTDVLREVAIGSETIYLPPASYDENTPAADTSRSSKFTHPDALLYEDSTLAHDGTFGFTRPSPRPWNGRTPGTGPTTTMTRTGRRDLRLDRLGRLRRPAAGAHQPYAAVIDDRSYEPVNLPFTDVPGGYWAYDAIQHVYGEALMAGISGSIFNPSGTTTRGQSVTILWRLSGSPVVNYLMDFSDVDPAAYYGEGRSAGAPARAS